MLLSTTSLWITAIALKAFAVFRLWRHRSLFPWLLAFLSASVLRSAVLMALRPQHAALYRDVMAATGPVLMALETMAALSIFWRLTEQYPNWRKAGSFVLGVISGMGIGGAWLLRMVGVQASVAWQAVYTLQRHWMLGLAIVLLLILRLVRVGQSISSVPVRPIAVRAAQCLAVSCGGGTVTALLVMQAGLPTPAWAYAVGPLMGCVNGLLCAAWLPRASAACAAFTVPPPDNSREVVRFGIATLWRSMEQMRLKGHSRDRQWSPATPSAEQTPSSKAA